MGGYPKKIIQVIRAWNHTQTVTGWRLGIHHRIRNPNSIFINKYTAGQGLLSPDIYLKIYLKILKYIEYKTQINPKGLPKGIPASKNSLEKQATVHFSLLFVIPTAGQILNTLVDFLNTGSLNSSQDIHGTNPIFDFAPWLVVLTCFNHLEKYEFVNGKDDIPYMKWNIKNSMVPVTTNQHRCLSAWIPQRLAPPKPAVGNWGTVKSDSGWGKNMFQAPKAWYTNCDPRCLRPKSKFSSSIPCLAVWCTALQVGEAVGAHWTTKKKGVNQDVSRKPQAKPYRENDPFRSVQCKAVRQWLTFSWTTKALWIFNIRHGSFVCLCW